MQNKHDNVFGNAIKLMSLSNLLSVWRALKPMGLCIIYLSYFPIMFSISAEMYLAGMCLGSDLFGKSSPL